MISTSTNPASLYWQYLANCCPTLPAEPLPQLQADLAATNWEDPQTALDFNNVAVMALIEAEQTETPELKAMGLELALEALQQGLEVQPSHPLCAAHLAVIRNLIGESEAAFQIALPVFINLLQYAYNTDERLPLGLIYMPFNPYSNLMADRESWQQILQAESGPIQTLQLLSKVLQDLQLVFYNSGGKRFLQLAAQLFPNSVSLNLKLGLTHLMKHEWEGLLNLQQARAIAPDCSPVVQALYLAYRELQPNVADYWLQYGREWAATNPTDSAWQWTTLSPESPFTYVPFQQQQLAVDSSIYSIVTIVLLAEGDWFEAEMEFWRDQLQPGMTVIDVGANVGVYTFSAAQQVGATGQVFAIEPFSGCVRCLTETRQLNQFEWVKICPGAASDRHGTLHLSLQAASELNEVVTDPETLPEGTFEAVRSFPLDSLIEQGLTQVDWLKIDAEGHEMQVLQGSDRILTEFRPAILYENVAGTKGSNIPVAEYLQTKGYQLFRYQPYLKNLIPIESIDQLQGNLNIIALPADRIAN